MKAAKEKEVGKKPKKKIAYFKNNMYMMKLIWKVSPKFVLLMFLSSFTGFASWAASNVLFARYVFGGIYSGSFTQASILILTFTVAIGLITALNQWTTVRLKRKLEPKIHNYLNTLLFNKATKVDIACFETPEFYDNYTKATAEAFSRAMSVLTCFTEIFGALFSSVWVIMSLFQINVIAGIFSFLPMIGSFLFGKLTSKIYYQKNQDDIPFKRREDYANRVMYLQKYAKEIRLSNIFHVTQHTYAEGYDGMIQNVNKYRAKIFWFEDTKNALCFPVVFEGMWLFGAYLAMVAKSILITDFAVLARSIVATTWMLRAFTDSLNQSIQNGLYIENLRDFLGYKEDIPEDYDGDDVPSIVEDIELRNVSFTYKDASNPVIKNVSIKLAAGEKISLVGHNGAGKSTLIKLIMRLYDPTEGEILLNGRNIKEFNLKAYRNLIGTTFQDFQMLSMTVAENVLLEPVTTDEQHQRAITALKLSDVYDKIRELPHDVDTILTREFDDEGAVLSGGQFQKIAVARAFAKDSPIVLLDEPSSALDPVAEYQMYETIMALSDSKVEATGQDRLSIVISHRLSSASMADKIYLLEQGMVIEQGTHKELMILNGAYADMYKKQAESYLQAGSDGGAA